MAALADLPNAMAGFSRLYRTPAFPAGSGPDFINAAVAVNWSGTAQELLAELHRIERSFGRTRRTRWEARVLDLDLIAFGDQVRPDPETQAKWRDLDAGEAAKAAPEELILPHPRLAERSFVLLPFADIAPDWVHPLTGLSVAQMLAALPDGDFDGIDTVDPPPGALPSAPIDVR